MADSRTKLKNLLRELFQLDSADLDFGIYRIMNSKRSEIERFLDHDLLPQIKEAFLQYKSSDSIQVKAELEKLVQQLKDADVDPELSSKVKALREKLSTAIDVSALENQVFSDLFNFFRRYYNEGDFLSLRRYKEGVYAIPYEGEEVKLYWANHDQHYIKTSQYLREYAFKLADGRRVHFRLAAADIEKDNNKPANSNDRRFILAEGDPVTEENGELVIRFDFRPDAENRRQDALNAHAARAVLEAPGTGAWLFALAALDHSEADPKRTVLAKYLKDYTERNTFDYFIHKDVGPFLRRELDFFIKNEVMHLDDIESASAPRVEQYLSAIRVLRRIAHKIIDFVAQLENFQKKLWLKKKFVVETNYCITLDRVPESMYPEIGSNEAQREEWVKLCAIDEIGANLTHPGYSVPLTVEFLKSHPTLVLDTRHFSKACVLQMLSTVANLDQDTDGLLIHSENFQALRFLDKSIGRKVDFVYIDPPYNTDATEIIYKNGYKESSWLANAVQLTSFGRGISGSPRWSPDGRMIAFDSNVSDTFHIYVISSGGGQPVQLTDSPSTDAVPNWSRDGAWIYFTSWRTGRTEVWKVRPSGGPEIQVTRDGSALATESADGKSLYVIRGSEDLADLFRVGMDGSHATKVLSSVRGRLFTVLPKGIYFAAGSPQAELRYLEFATGTVRTIAPLPGMPHADVSSDEHWALYCQPAMSDTNLMVVENFR